MFLFVYYKTVYTESYISFYLFLSYVYIEEDNYGRNADLITKHFIAEGIVSDHSILIADVEKKPETTVSFFIHIVQEKMNRNFTMFTIICFKIFCINIILHQYLPTN